MTLSEPPVRSTAIPPVDPLAEAIADVEGYPDPATDGEAKTKDFTIIFYSGELEPVWATMILASTAAAMGVRCRVFATFWGLQVFVKEDRRITGESWMQKMLSLMQRPGIRHRKLSKMNFLGMGPWMMGKLAADYNFTSPAELLEAAQAMGVEFIPCQMTMDMFGLKREDMIEGLGEPAGAAAVIELITNGDGALFI